MSEELEELRRTRFPLANNTATVLLAVMLAWVDQMMVSRAKMTKLLSPEIMSSGETRLEIGCSPLALHTGVGLGTLWNHIPRYELKVLLEGLLPIWKKPSANLPLLETSLLSPARERPRESVSAAAAHEGACSEKRNPQRRRRRRRRRRMTTTMGTDQERRVFACSQGSAAVLKMLIAEWLA